MQTFLKRYQQGECLTVWAELVSLGAAVRDEPLLSDARAVAQEMMTRAKHNIALLVERLQRLEYRFAYPDRVWVTPNSELLTILDALEKQYGPLPIVLRAWYEVVGVVNFMGAHPKLSYMEGLHGGGPTRLSDPLMVECDDPTDLEPYFINLADSNIELATMRADRPPPYGFCFALSAINKAGQSGIGGIEILFPNPAFDAPILDGDFFWMGTFFVPYLRTCFEWGGFPGLRPNNSQIYPDTGWDPGNAKPIMKYLTKDLLPL